MDEGLKVRRRVLLKTYQRFMVADRAWIDASNTARDWVRGIPKGVIALGTPRSRMRALYAERERALRRLQVARYKLEVAANRVRSRKRNLHHPPRRPVLLLAP